MKTHRIFIFSMMTLLLLGSCEKQLDINQDPSRLTGGQVNEAGLLPSSIQYTATSFWNAGQYGNFYPQYLAGNAGQASNIDSYNPYGFDNIWESAYLRAIPTIKDLISRAEINNLPHYKGIGQLLLALNLMQSTDIWGDLPYSEAFDASKTLNPKYDSQESIYNIVLKNLLDEALINLGKPAPTENGLKVGATDLIYKGNISKWIKAAYTARARYYIHLSKKDAGNLDKAAADVENGLNVNTGADDLQLAYTSERNHPWYSTLSIATPASRYARPSSYFVNLLNGTGAYPGLLDPRISKLVDNNGATQYIGRPVGSQDNENGASLANTDITANTFYGKTTSVVPIVTYTEGQFIKAEALFTTNKQGAYDAYREGIRSSMIKFGVPALSIDAYINNPLISKGFVNLTLSDIMLQKYIALFLQMETWTDMRRYQYDTSIYKGLNKPFRNLLGTEWVQRGNYPDNEPGRNTNVPKVANQAVKIWLFQ